MPQRMTLYECRARQLAGPAGAVLARPRSCGALCAAVPRGSLRGAMLSHPLRGTFFGALRSGLNSICKTDLKIQKYRT